MGTAVFCKGRTKAMTVIESNNSCDHVIQWEDGKFRVFIGASGLPEYFGWDVLMSSGFSCTYQTSDPESVRRLTNMGVAISQQAADKLNEL
jgi:hypothetical protein